MHYAWQLSTPVTTVAYYIASCTLAIGMCLNINRTSMQCHAAIAFFNDIVCLVTAIQFRRVASIHTCTSIVSVRRGTTFTIHILCCIWSISQRSPAVQCRKTNSMCQDRSATSCKRHSLFACVAYAYNMIQHMYLVCAGRKRCAAVVRLRNVTLFSKWSRVYFVGVHLCEWLEVLFLTILVQQTGFLYTILYVTTHHE